MKTGNVCPYCNSTEVLIISPFKKLGKAWLTGEFSQSIVRQTCICKKCGNEWEESVSTDELKDDSPREN